MEKSKRCATCDALMDRHSKICRGCYLKAVEKDPEERRVRHNAYQKRWRAENHERSNEIARRSHQKWWDADPARAREVQRLNRERVRKQILELLGGVSCATCGFGDWRALHVDHRGGGGNRERVRGLPITVGLGLWKFRALIVKNVAAARRKYQVLCANCNWIKRHEAKECRGTVH